MSQQRPRESAWTGVVLGGLKASMGTAWTILKHADQFTTGIPDFSASYTDRWTLWVEVKVLRKPSQVLTAPESWVDNQVQLMTAVRLGGYYLVYDPFRDWCGFIAALEVARYLRNPTPDTAVELNWYFHELKLSISQVVQLLVNAIKELKRGQL